MPSPLSPLAEIEQRVQQRAKARQLRLEGEAATLALQELVDDEQRHQREHGATHVGPEERMHDEHRRNGGENAERDLDGRWRGGVEQKLQQQHHQHAD